LVHSKTHKEALTWNEVLVDLSAVAEGEFLADGDDNNGDDDAIVCKSGAGVEEANLQKKFNNSIKITGSRFILNIFLD